MELEAGLPPGPCSSVAVMVDVTDSGGATVTSRFCISDWGILFVARSSSSVQMEAQQLHLAIVSEEIRAKLASLSMARAD